MVLPKKKLLAIKNAQTAIALCLTSKEDLRAVHLSQLADEQHPLTAIVIKKGTDPESCKLIAAAIEKLYQGTTYNGDAGHIGSHGISLFQACHEKRMDEYYNKAGSEFRALRKAANSLLPVDILRLLLDEIWHHGAMLERFERGRIANFGLNRIIHQGPGIKAHSDRALADLGFNNARANALLTQLAYNSYVQVPKRGGELQLWNTHLEDPSVSPSATSINKTIPKPDLVLVPELGDWIIFNANKPHGVGDVIEGPSRLTCSSFIGYYGDDQPVSIFS